MLALVGEKDVFNRGTEIVNPEQLLKQTAIAPAPPYYYDFDKGERVRGTWRVTLVMPATYFGTVEVDALSEGEAAEVALNSDWHEIDWDESASGDHHGIEVLEVEPENPPEGGVLMEPALSNASIDSLFEPSESSD
jgi:hypothetical protein